jgi:hypothetical protein
LRGAHDRWSCDGARTFADRVSRLARPARDHTPAT